MSVLWNQSSFPSCPHKTCAPMKSWRGCNKASIILSQAMIIFRFFLSQTSSWYGVAPSLMWCWWLSVSEFQWLTCPQATRRLIVQVIFSPLCCSYECKEGSVTMRQWHDLSWHIRLLLIAVSVIFWPLICVACDETWLQFQGLHFLLLGSTSQHPVLSLFARINRVCTLHQSKPGYR